jgi:hypothetical protein
MISRRRVTRKPTIWANPDAQCPKGQVQESVIADGGINLDIDDSHPSNV